MGWGNGCSVYLGANANAFRRFEEIIDYEKPQPTEEIRAGHFGGLSCGGIIL
jgi:hypothetical protein